jgi:methyl-accepting chemotaxis protein
MKNISLKWKLTFSVVGIWIAVGFVLVLIGQKQFTRVDEQLFDARGGQAIANGKSVAAAISFELKFSGEEESKTTQKNLNEFLQNNSEVYAIEAIPLSESKAISTGQPIDTKMLLSSFPDTKKPYVKRIGRLIVAQVPALLEEEQVGTVLYVESLQSYFDERERMTNAMVGLGFGSLIALIIGAYIIGVQSSKPIHKLVTAARHIADGDLANVDIEAGGTNETGLLSRSIKKMASAIQKQVSAIKKLTNELASVSKDISGTMTHLTSSASEQAAAVTETATTVEEMEKAGRSAANNANRIVEAADKTTEASIRGRRAVDKTNEIIIKIQKDSVDISNKSKNLLNSVEEVGNIIRTVNGIAEQSKILAVNASIEAAKAGEYGSGFAVVAQEVKDLAQQSKDATFQITETLNGIRKAIETMVTTAKSGKERTEEGVNTIANAGAIMNDLSEAIRENSDFANVISTNINQQTVGLAQIATAIEEINSTAMENQNISSNILSGTKQMNNSFVVLTELIGRWRTPDEDVDES